MRQAPAAALVAALISPSLAACADAARPVGLVVPVPAARMMEVAERLPRLVDRALARGGDLRLVLDFNPDGAASAAPNFGAARELARRIREAGGRVRTVAYVHGELTRHSVLPVLACQEVVLSDAPPARLGRVVARGGAPLEADERLAYAAFAGGRGWAALVRPALVRAMCDPAAPAAYSAAQARALGLAGRGACDTVADALGPDRDDLSALVRSPKQPVVARLVLVGPVDSALEERLKRYVRDALAHKANVLILHLECGGGDAGKALDIARWLLEIDRGRAEQIETIAYVAPQARDTASLLAFACDRIVLHPDARLGVWEPYVRAHPGQEQAIRDGLGEVARSMNHPEAVARALADHGQQVRPDGGAYLTLDAETARRLGVAEVADGPAALYRDLGVGEADVLVIQRDFLDALGETLRSDWVRLLLVALGIVGLVLELKLPGTTVPGVVAAVCFVLFFWSHGQLGGQMALLAGLLFALGLVLLALEVFVLPGLGFCGVAGVVLTLGGLGLAAYGRWPAGGGEWAALGKSASPFGLAVFVAVGLAFLLAHYLPRLPLASRLMLDPHAAAAEDEDGPPQAAERPGGSAELLGAMGVAATPLRPAGKSQFGEEFVDVVAEGGYVAPGARVQVVEVEGNRVVVKEV